MEFLVEALVDGGFAAKATGTLWVLCVVLILLHNLPYDPLPARISPAGKSMLDVGLPHPSHLHSCHVSSSIVYKDLGYEANIYTPTH